MKDSHTWYMMTMSPDMNFVQNYDPWSLHAMMKLCVQNEYRTEVQEIKAFIQKLGI